jgi:hypothetical protein
MTKRVLITGSRDWDDIPTCINALAQAMVYFDEEPFTLVSGACPTGADRICEELWEGIGEIERHHADWVRYARPDGKANPAGFIRNAEMVKLGADLCLAFIKNDSKGAMHTVNLAEKSGIKTWRYICE